MLSYAKMLYCDGRYQFVVENLPHDAMALSPRGIERPWCNLGEVKSSGDSCAVWAVVWFLGWKLGSSSRMPIALTFLPWQSSLATTSGKQCVLAGMLSSCLPMLPSASCRGLEEGNGLTPIRTLCLNNWIAAVWQMAGALKSCFCVRLGFQSL